MPEGSITRQKIRDHLRRLWPVYLAGFALLIFLNNLVYTVTRPAYGDDATLKIVLLNADISIEEDSLLEKTRHLGFETVEILPLSIAAGDASSEMLLYAQLISGFGDIYIADDAGLKLLEGRDVCGNVRPAGNGLHAVVISNGTTVERAEAAMEFLEKTLGE